MKIIALGDTHGEQWWKEIVETEKDADKIIFVGDYFDSFYVRPKDQIENFKEIIEFKKQNIDKVELLFGNHDFHYLSKMGERYCGYKKEHSDEYQVLIKDALREGLMKMAHIEGEYLFSHAGISSTWLVEAGFEAGDVAAFVNGTFKTAPEKFKFFDKPGSDTTGDNIYQSPIWIRPRSLAEDATPKYIQVIGHTRQLGGIKSIHEKDDIIMIDTLTDYIKDYLEITNDKPKIKTVWKNQNQKETK